MWWLNILIFSLILTLSCAYDNTKWLKVDALRYRFLVLENSLWNMTVNGSLSRNKPRGGGEMYLVKKFDEFDQQIQQLPQLPADYLTGMTPLRNNPQFKILLAYLGIVSVKYAKFRHYLKLKKLDTFKKMFKNELMYDLLNKPSGINKVMTAIYDLSYGQQSSLHQELVKLVDDDYWCRQWVALSPKQSYYQLYNFVSFYGLIAYILKQFTYLESHIDVGSVEQRKFEQLSENDRKSFEQMTLNIYRQLDKVKWHSNVLLSCDPRSFIEGSNYEQFTRFMQLHIEQEKYLGGIFCTKECNYYTNVKMKSCSGPTRNCRFHGFTFGTCESGPGSSRKYEFVKIDKGAMGTVISCPRSRYEYLKFWISPGLFWRCDFCVCFCEYDKHSDRYISLRSVLSDVKQNMVVTGLRFVKHNHMLHLQIQEGKLISYGQIDQNSVRWKPVDNFKMTDCGVREGHDYFALTYDEHEMALDDPAVDGLIFNVLTGVSFYRDSGMIRFRVDATPFNWETGALYTQQTTNNIQLYGATYKISFTEGDVPTKTTTNTPYLKGHHYVKFWHSDLMKDAAQTTIPFIDTLSISSSPVMPLLGAGLYYRGRKGFGGFIAPLIKTYDHLNLLHSEMPPILSRFVNSTAKNPKDPK